MTIFKLNFQQFRKNQILFISYLVLIVGSFFFISLGMPMKTSLSSIMLVSQKLSMISFIYFAFVAYEYQKAPEMDNLFETICTIKSAKIRMYVSRLFILLTLVFLFALIPVVVTSIYAANVLSKFAYDYILYILQNDILNILLVGVLATLLGTILALNFNRVKAYIILLLAIFFISPFFETIAFSIYYMMDVNPYPYFDLFHILPFDLDWVPDAFYGIGIEAIRWNLIFFWIFLLAAAILIKLRTPKMKTRALIILFAMLSIVNLIYYSLPSSIVRYDYRPDGAAFGDDIYETDIASETDGYGKEANFSVLSYDMKLKIRRQLDAEISMVIENMEGNNAYEFTLYRGYEISSLTDEEGNNLSYSRNGNYFTINEVFTEDVFSVNIAYAGSGNRYFSNYQGTALLGYAPYYPKAGHQQLWDQGEHRLVVNAGSQMTDYKVTVDSLGVVYSNLPGEDDNFSGLTTEVTLVSGLISPFLIGDRDVVSPISDVIEETEIIEFENSWKNIMNLLDLDESYEIAGKKIIVTPLVTTRASAADNEMCVIMSDHVLVSQESSSQNVYALVNSIIPYHNLKRQLKLCVAEYLCFNEIYVRHYESYEPDYDLLKFQVVNDQDDIIVEEEIMKYQESTDAMYSLLAYKIDSLGEEYVLPIVFDYLTDNTTIQDEVDFLYNLQ